MKDTLNLKQNSTNKIYVSEFPSKSNVCKLYNFRKVMIILGGIK